MSRGFAIVWGVLTLLPVVHMVYFMASFGPSPETQTYEESKAQFEFLWRLHLASMLVTVGLMLGYIYYLFKTRYVPADKKALWAVVLFLGNMFAMPVFWFHYVWKPALGRGDAS